MVWMLKSRSKFFFYVSSAFFNAGTFFYDWKPPEVVTKKLTVFGSINVNVMHFLIVRPLIAFEDGILLLKS